MATAARSRASLTRKCLSDINEAIFDASRLASLAASRAPLYLAQAAPAAATATATGPSTRATAAPDRRTPSVAANMSWRNRVAFSASGEMRPSPEAIPPSAVSASPALSPSSLAASPAAFIDVPAFLKPARVAFAARFAAFVACLKPRSRARAMAFASLSVMPSIDWSLETRLEISALYFSSTSSRAGMVHVLERSLAVAFAITFAPFRKGFTSSSFATRRLLNGYGCRMV